jgi:cytochrome c556
MFSLIKDWKEYRVHLGEFSAAVKALAGENYKGMSADYKMTLWFEEEPSAEITTAIDAAWEALTEEAEAAKFKLDADRAAAVAAAKEALLTADFADLIPAERKIWMNRELTVQDLDAILLKFPQA